MDSKCTPSDIMVCYRVKNNGACPLNSNNAVNNNSHQMANGLDNAMHGDPLDAMRQDRLPQGVPLKQSKSRELRAGVMYTGCDCEKRNGLQDDCLRSECRGSPQCLTKPNPTCGPSQFSNWKHLELKRLHMEQVRKSFKDATTASNPSNPNNDLNIKPGSKKKSTPLKAENHPVDCCGDAIYRCVEGVVVEQKQNQHENGKGGGAKCPGTAQCGPRLCPVGECVGGVCASDSNNNLSSKMENHRFGEKKDVGSINQTACPCNGKGRAH